MPCEGRRRRGYNPSAADLAFHRRLVAEIRESLKDRRQTLSERLQALIELEHHQQHQNDVTQAIYCGTPLPDEDPDVRVRTLPHGAGDNTGQRSTYELPAKSSHRPVSPLLVDQLSKQAVKRKASR